MAIQIQLRQGTTTEHNTFKGAVGEVTVDTTKKTVVVHDGVTLGGTVLAKVSEVPSLIPQATETALGVAKIATTAISQAGTNDTDFITPLKLKSVSFGVGQIWQDVTSSRNLESTYSNGTGKPIQVAITIAGQNNFSPSVLFVNGLEIVRVSNSTQYGQDKNICIVIPSGSTYRLSGSAFSRWSELR